MPCSSGTHGNFALYFKTGYKLSGPFSLCPRANIGQCNFIFIILRFFDRIGKDCLLERRHIAYANMPSFLKVRDILLSFDPLSFWQVDKQKGTLDLTLRGSSKKGGPLAGLLEKGARVPGRVVGLSGMCGLSGFQSELQGVLSRVP